MTYFANRLSGKAHSLQLPRKSTDDVQRHVRMHQTAGPEYAPFRRQLDFWAFSIATALALDLPPLDQPSSQWGRKFTDTKSVEMSDDLCDLLAVVAFHHIGKDHDDIDDPAQIIEVANRFAGSGCPVVLEQLSRSDLRLTPLAKILDLASELHTKSTSSD
jgi:hypothetical protein